MRDHDGGLPRQALLYAHGELAAEEAAAFERLLGEEQSARDALAQAVALAQKLDEIPARRPDPRYRREVRRRLLLPLKERSIFRHPALWCLCGAAAALLAVLPLWYLRNAPVPTEQTPPPLTQEEAAIQPPATPPASGEMEIAQAWIEIRGSERLLKVHGEEQRRKNRLEDRRLSRSDDHADRYITMPMTLDP